MPPLFLISIYFSEKAIYHRNNDRHENQYIMIGWCPMDFEEFIKTYHNYNPFANSIGFRLTAMSDGHAEAMVPLTPTLFNPIGSVHGGVLYTIADTVGGCAARTRGQIPTTMEGKLNHIRATTEQNKYLTCKANVLHFGQKTVVTSVNIYNDNEQLVAAALFTFYILDKSVLKSWI